MTLSVLIDENPFARSGASANRWRSMIEGLANQGINIEVLILGGYQNALELQQFGRSGCVDDSVRITYRYLGAQFNGNIWIRRFQRYILDWIRPYFNGRRVCQQISKSGSGCLFLYPSLQVFRTVQQIPEWLWRDVRLVLEINEYDDVRNEHATSRLQVWVNDMYRRILKEFVFPRLDACIVMTRCLISYYSTFPRLKDTLQFYHLPMSVDMRRFDEVNASVPYQTPYIAYCGSSSFKKDGVDILIRAFEEIAAHFPDLHLYIAAFWESDGPKMAALMNSSEFGDRIKYLGAVGREQVVDLVSNATICALPRPNSRQASGGFPTKLGEYLATGNPVCVTAVGEIPDYLVDGESAYLVRPGDAHEFALALRRVLDNPTDAIRVGLNGKKVAEQHFDIFTQSKLLAEFLRSIFAPAQRGVSV